MFVHFGKHRTLLHVFALFLHLCLHVLACWPASAGPRPPQPKKKQTKCNTNFSHGSKHKKMQTQNAEMKCKCQARFWGSEILA